MTYRIVLGDYGGTMVTRISKPGYNVLSTGQANLLMTEYQKMLQVMYSGVLAIPGTSGTAIYGISYPDAGFIPLVWYSPGTGSSLNFPLPHAAKSDLEMLSIYQITRTATYFKTDNVATLSHVRYILFFLKNITA